MGKPDIYVITGGGGGIGVACARRLGKKGTLLLNDVDSDRVSKAAAQLRSEGFNVETIIEDISNEGCRNFGKNRCVNRAIGWCCKHLVFLREWGSGSVSSRLT